MKNNNRKYPAALPKLCFKGLEAILQGPWRYRSGGLKDTFCSALCINALRRPIRVASLVASRRALMVLLLLCCLAGQAPLLAQKAVRATPRQERQMIALINRTSASIRAMSCDFRQVSNLSFMDSKAVSEGRMSYSADGKLTWQYTAPYSYTFTIDNGKVTTTSGSRTTTIDTGSNKLYRNITQLMMNSVSGRSLSGNRDFTVHMYTRGGWWIAYLYPRGGDMKRLFKTVRLYFSKGRRMVQKVEMVQPNGDDITITLLNQKVSYRR